MMLDEKSNEAYALLAGRYKQVNAGAFKELFEEFYLYAKVLSVKMNIGVWVREAYRRRDREALTYYVDVEIPRMIEYMKTFIDQFEKRWLSENMAFGLEVHHLFYGGQLLRWEYEVKQLRNYLQTGEPIEELEREYLPVCAIPPAVEDRCRVMDYHYLISNCNL